MRDSLANMFTCVCVILVGLLVESTVESGILLSECCLCFKGM